MTKIEQIEQMLNEWKAAKENDDDPGGVDWCCALTAITVLEAALGILEAPSNTRMHMDSLNIEHKPDCELMQTGAPVCTCGAENGCQ